MKSRVVAETSGCPLHTPVPDAPANHTTMAYIHTFDTLGKSCLFLRTETRGRYASDVSRENFGLTPGARLNG